MASEFFSQGTDIVLADLAQNPLSQSQFRVYPKKRTGSDRILVAPIKIFANCEAKQIGSWMGHCLIKLGNIWPKTDPGWVWLFTSVDQGYVSPPTTIHVEDECFNVIGSSLSYHLKDWNSVSSINLADRKCILDQVIQLHLLDFDICIANKQYNRYRYQLDGCWLNLETKTLLSLEQVQAFGCDRSDAWDDLITLFVLP